MRYYYKFSINSEGIIFEYHQAFKGLNRFYNPELLRIYIFFRADVSNTN